LNKSKYLKDFEDETADIPSQECPYEEILDQTARVDIILIGDYRPLSQSQKFIADFISDITSKNRKIIVLTDLFFSREQQILDHFMTGKISEKTLLRRTDYSKKWGYPWKNYKPIFDTIKRLNVGIHAVDTRPRNDMRYIRRRDTNLAWKINRISKKNRGSTLLLFTGESRIAKGHIPLLIERHFIKPKPKILRIFQNLDCVYEKHGRNFAKCYRIAEYDYCVMNASREEKIDSLRKIKELWEMKSADDEKLDLEPTVYSLIDELLKFLNINRYKHPLESYEGISPFIVDNYPEIVPVPRSKNARGSGSLFVPSENRLFISHFDLIHGGEEAAHYINSALKGELYRPPEPRNRFDDFYVRTIEEAIGFFGSKVLAPRREFVSLRRFDEFYDKTILSIMRDHEYNKAELELASEFIEEHYKFEKDFMSYKSIPEIIKQKVSEENKLAPLLFHDLGYKLGEKLWNDYKKGKISKGRIKKLFKEKFTPQGKSFDTYLELVNL